MRQRPLSNVLTSRRSTPIGNVLLAAVLVLGIVVLTPSTAFGHSEHGIAVDTTLTGDHVGGLVITADNVSLDCDHHWITPANGEAVGIEVFGRTGVTIRNCYVSGFDTGILLSGSSGNRLLNNRAQGNNFGFFVKEFSHSNTLDGNVAVSNENLGFQIGDSDGNKLRNNTADLNGGGGFSLVETTRTLLTNNSATGNFDGYSVVSASGNVLIGNVDFSSERYGFSVVEADGVQSDGNLLVGNTASGSSEAGFIVIDSDDNILIRNEGVSGDTGFIVTDAAANNLLVRNDASFNSGVSFLDESSGGGDAGTANAYNANTCADNGEASSSPVGLCQ